jgi:hypothetical protein
MKYYSNFVFRLLNSLYTLAIIATIFLTFFFYMISGMGDGASNYTEMVINQILIPGLGIILFLFVSIPVLFLQQYKNRRLGYLMIIFAPLSAYIVYNVLSYLPILDLIYASFEGSVEPVVGFFWILVASLIIIIALIPFYVLGKLIREDFFSERIAKR